MGVLREFSEQEREHDIYQRRMRTLSMIASYKGAIEERDKMLEETAKQMEEKDAIIEELKRKLEGKD